MVTTGCGIERVVVNRFEGLAIGNRLPCVIGMALTVCVCVREIERQRERESLLVSLIPKANKNYAFSPEVLKVIQYNLALKTAWYH